MTNLFLHKFGGARSLSYISLGLALFITLLFSSSVYGSPSYADYSFKENGPFFNFDIYSTWDHDIELSTGIYPAFNFYFQNGQGGYMGMQSDNLGKHVLFSIWDDVNGSMSAMPVSSNCKRFSHEGTGTMCLNDFSWAAGREYRLRVWVLDVVGNTQNWGAWILDTVSQQETNIGVISLRNSGEYQGYGWLTRSSVFLERYISAPLGGCDAQPVAKVIWRGPYANNSEATANRAVVSFSHNPTSCLNSNVWSSEYPFINQEDGGATQRITTEYTDAWALPLFVTISGTGSGAVNSIPSGIACSNTCNKNFTRDSALSLIATPDANSIFSGWNGACSGTASCTLTLSRALEVTSTFTEADKVRIGMTPYSNLSGAFANGGLIQARAIEFNEILTVTQPTIFKGGWNAAYDSNSGSFTIIYGPLTISSGCLTVEGLEIR